MIFHVNIKSKNWFLAVVLASLLLGYGLGYHTASKRARTPSVVLEVDAKDTPQPGAAKADFEPYFTRGNPISGQIK